MKPYLLIEFTIEPADPGRDILLATLDVEGYDSFEETPKGLKAYILEDDFDEKRMKELAIMNSQDFKIEYELDKLENKNWNEEWETNYEPIDLDGQVYIRAPFHSSKSEYPIEIIIEPKMSFGTGHHQTTRLMSRLILQMEMEGKKVLDMGTGTGVLAILAEIQKAKEILAIDNFEWAVENTIENAEKNNCKKVTAQHGDADSLKNMTFDVVLANINRNVLLEDMKTYIDTLSVGGELVLSGFFEVDFDLLNDEAVHHNMELVTKTGEDRWLACHYRKTA